MAVQEHECTIAEAAVLLEMFTDEGDSSMLWGPPGIGKSDIVHQLGAKKGARSSSFTPRCARPLTCAASRSPTW